MRGPLTPARFLGNDTLGTQPMSMHDLIRQLREPNTTKIVLMVGKSGVLQPIMPLDLPVKVRPWELTVYPRSHIRR